MASGTGPGGDADARRALWTALRYPALALERLGPRDPDAAHAVVARDGARRFVLACDAAAAEAGVRTGLALSSALALAPGLVAIEHDAAALEAHLELLALAALEHSSIVVPRPPDTVLIESGGSLALFGGIGAFVARLREAAAADALTALVATAPTPAGAHLLARAGRELALATPAGLRRALAPLPLAPLGLEAAVRSGLERSGIRSVGALLDLPPASVARRFGAALADALYRLDGRLPDPQVPLAVPPAFRAGADCPLDAATSGALAFLLRRLIAALAGYLRGADLGVGALRVTLRHRHRPPTVLEVALSGTTADAARLARTVGTRLERTALEAPVTRVELEALGLAPVERARVDLLDASGEGGAAGGPGRDDREAVGALVDELAARLGDARVYTALAHDEHRPEAASARVLPARRGVPGPWPARPLWLLRAPLEAPRSLELASAPERIESGWWDETDVRRDYFIARDARGVHYWVFRRRGGGEGGEPDGRLWIHGLFA